MVITGACFIKTFSIPLVSARFVEAENFQRDSSRLKILTEASVKIFSVDETTIPLIIIQVPVMLIHKN